MKKKDDFTKILTLAGTGLVWFPILAPLMLFLMAVLVDRIFRFDYLMPAELFPFALIGAGLLLWAALRARAWWKLIGWSFGTAAGFLVISQAIAVFTGLASGKSEPVGWWWLLVLASLVIYSLALVAMGIGGGLLLCHLFKAPQLVNDS
jgi:hypothetical protein